MRSNCIVVRDAGPKRDVSHVIVMYQLINSCKEQCWSNMIRNHLPLTLPLIQCDSGRYHQAIVRYPQENERCMDSIL